jgi:hypothetical protein
MIKYIYFIMKFICSIFVIKLQFLNHNSGQNFLNSGQNRNAGLNLVEIDKNYFTKNDLLFNKMIY